MECEICCRGHDSQRLPFLCAVDARNQLYEDRFKHLQITLETDALRSQINELLNATQGADAADSLRAKQVAAKEETSQILQAAEKLRREIEATRNEYLAKDLALARRRADLASAREGLVERRAKHLRDIKRSSETLKYRWSQGAEDMASCRGFLCAEAADLYGLRRVLTEGSRTLQYHIGKVPVVNLTQMNCMLDSNHIFLRAMPVWLLLILL